MNARFETWLMFLISKEVSSLTSFRSVFSRTSNQWSCVSFGLCWKSVVLSLPPGTHHLFGKAFSFGLRLQIRYLPSGFRIIAVTAIWWVFVLGDFADSHRFGNCLISFIIEWVFSI